MSKDNNKIRICLNNIKKISSDLTIIHHFHKYIKIKFEKNNIFCINDFIFTQPNKFSCNKSSSKLELDFNNELIVQQLFEISEVYKK